MASTFDTAMALTVVQTLAAFGEAITYTPVGLAGRSISAVVARETRQWAGGEDQDATRVHETMEILISARDNTEGVTAPAEFGVSSSAGDQCTIDGETWYVSRVIDGGVAGMHRLALTSKRISGQRG